MLDDLPLPDSARVAARVACSTSNLGPGFDLAGLALELWLDVSCEPAAHARAHAWELGGGAEAWPRGSENVLLVAFDRGASESGLTPHARLFRVRSEIPVGRGLGSSGAAVVAGLLLGASLGPRSVSRERLLQLAVEVEGHPDNVSPALLGGCVLSVPRERAAPRTIRQALHPTLHFGVAWPQATLATAHARRILPASVPFRDAVENPRRLALLLEGLRSGQRELIELGGVDRLHVAHRLPLIPGGAAALDAARNAGAWLATISGSGSGLFFVAGELEIAGVVEAARRELERESPPAVGRVLRVAAQPARVAVHAG